MVIDDLNRNFISTLENRLNHIGLYNRTLTETHSKFLRDNEFPVCACCGSGVYRPKVENTYYPYLRLTNLGIFFNIDPELTLPSLPELNDPIYTQYAKGGINRRNYKHHEEYIKVDNIPLFLEYRVVIKDE